MPSIEALPLGVTQGASTLESHSEATKPGRRNPSLSGGPSTPRSPRAAATRKEERLLSGPFQPVLLPTVNRGVYFAERDDGCIKIGQSGRIRQRLVQLRVDFKSRIRLLAVGESEYRNAKWINRYDIERRVHDEFREHHVGHEWFRPTPELLALVAEVARTGVLPNRFLRSLYDGPRIPRLKNGPRKPRRGVHFMRQKCLRKAELMLLTAALIEQYRAKRRAS
jgi:hypothetical protein